MRGSVLVAVAMTVGAGSAQAAGNATSGRQIFQSQCAMCHGVTPGSVGIGPGLSGIFGKPAASQPGYAYSAALKGAHLVWTDATLGKFLAAPQSVVPGTKMTFAGLPDAGQRADVIAYLAQISPAK
jgi:cytochrome c